MKKSIWIKVNGERTYFIRKNGKMAVGKVKINGKDYFFGNDGKLIKDNGDEWHITTEVTELTTGYIKTKFRLNYAEEDFDETSIWFVPQINIEQKKDGKWVRIDKEIYDEWDSCDYINEFYEVNNYEVTETNRFCRDMPVGEYRLKYNINKIDKNNKNESRSYYIEFNITETTPNKYGIWLEASDVKKDRMTVIINHNGTSKPTGEITYGEEYRIEKLNDKGEWEKLEGDVYTDDIGYSLDTGGRNKLRLNWQDAYGSLLRGKYRLVLSMSDFRKSGDYTNFESCAYFDITETTPNRYGIWLRVNDYDREKISVTFIHDDINYDGEIRNDNIWELQYQDKNGKWKKSKYKDDDIIYSDGSILINKYGESDMIINLNDLYGTLQRGSYRVKIPFVREKYGRIKDTFNIYAYFEI